nr:MAG TPA: hypothetical protein [Caudoviricetes sp.]
MGYCKCLHNTHVHIFILYNHKTLWFYRYIPWISFLSI